LEKGTLTSHLSDSPCPLNGLHFHFSASSGNKKIAYKVSPSQELKLLVDLITHLPEYLKYHYPMVPAIVTSHQLHTVLSTWQSHCLLLQFPDNADITGGQSEHPQWNHE